MRLFHFDFDVCLRPLYFLLGISVDECLFIGGGQVRWPPRHGVAFPPWCCPLIVMLYKALKTEQLSMLGWIFAFGLSLLRQTLSR